MLIEKEDQSRPEHAYPVWEAEITGAGIEVPDDIMTLQAVPALNIIQLHN